MNQNIQSRLNYILESSKKNEITECLEYRKNILRGYGRIRFNGNTTNAHRAVWCLTYNVKLPKNILVCHHCDNKLCVNISHLFLGDQTANMRDAAKKGRLSGKIKTLKQLQVASHVAKTILKKFRGQNHPMAKLNNVMVSKIKLSNDSHYKIAKQFGVSRSLISLIKSGKIWKKI